MEKLFFTESGVLRIRWWPLLGVAVWIIWVAVSLGMAASGASGRADPFIHAPLYWMFG